MATGLMLVAIFYFGKFYGNTDHNLLQKTY
jgi:hypothetical protein